jgi:hypothetical protein
MKVGFAVPIILHWVEQYTDDPRLELDNKCPGNLWLGLQRETPTPTPHTLHFFSNISIIVEEEV